MTELSTRCTRGTIRCVVTLLAGGFWYLADPGTVSAQAAAETAGATSVTNSVTVAAPKTTVVPPAQAKPATSSPHITAAMSASSPEANRADLEAKAGQNAARLLLRSTPSRAQVWIDGKAVGATPLLLIIAPGKYKIELRGTKQEYAERECALLPKETQEVVMNLQKMYPSRVIAH